jgi:hypothetical protein
MELVKFRHRVTGKWAGPYLSAADVASRKWVDSPADAPSFQRGDINKVAALRGVPVDDLEAEPPITPMTEPD